MEGGQMKECELACGNWSGGYLLDDLEVCEECFNHELEESGWEV